MSYKSDRRFYINLLKIFMIVALVGIIVLVYAALTHDTTNVAFSLIAFVISVAALMMTTLQSLSISRQLRITEAAMRLMRENDKQLEELVDEDKKLNEEIHQDLMVDRKIIEVLEEVGVGETESERRIVAEQIARRIENNS